MKIRKRFPLYVSLCAVLLLSVSDRLWSSLGIRVTCNLSSSMPKGFYRIYPKSPLKRGDLVVFWAPHSVRDLNRLWFRPEITLIKKVFGLPGDRVTIRNQIVINGRPVARVFRKDSQNLSLPQKRMCFRVSPKHFLPLSLHSVRSFDGRYFGEVANKDVLGKAKPIFTFN
jgi:conjugative transfer signal peptidase TraF